jgi:hypothetical protein
MSENMYIRLNKNSIRYRVSIEEANRLLAGEELTESVQLSTLHSLSYAITTVDRVSEFVYDQDNNRFCLFIEADELNREIEDRPSKQGIELSKKILNNLLIIALEVDLKRNRKVRRSQS